MAGFVANGSLADTLNYFKSNLNGGNLSVMLWTNDYHPDATTTFANLVEATFGGYTRKSVQGDWGPVTKIKDGEYATATVQYDWIPPTTGSQVIVGWALVVDGSNSLVLVERFATSFTIGGGSDHLLLALEVDMFDSPNYP